MNRTRTTFAAIAATAVLGTFGFAASTAYAAGPGAGAGDRTAGANLPAAASTINDEVKADLVFMVQEERLAEDVYAYIADKYDVSRPFTNIARSEQQHQDAVTVLLERYSLTDPSAGMAPGTYADVHLQELYDQLIAQADVSLSEAYKVGVAIEETDIADLKEALAEDGLPADVKVVYERLTAGSENHLKAFTTQTTGGTRGSHDGTGMQNGRGNTGQGAGRGAGR